MKKFLSLALAMIMSAALTVIGFAADAKANFSITPVSETDKQLIFSVDYNGGSSFSCFDLEISVNTDKLEIEKCESGKGMQSFTEYASSNGGAFPMSNILSKGQLKASFVSLVNYKNVSGKDLFVVTLKKLKSDKVQKSDVKLEFTSCGISDENVNITNVATVITSGLGGSVQLQTNDKTSAAAPNKNTEPSGASSVETDSNLQTENTAETLQTQQSAEQSDGAEETVNSEKNETGGENNTVKIVIIVVAVAVAAALIITATVMIVKKKKEN